MGKVIGMGLIIIILVMAIGITEMLTQKVNRNPPKTQKSFPADTALDQGIPQIQCVWRDGGMCGVLVPANTTSGQLKSLIWEFRGARAGRSLTRYIPGIKGDPHMRVMIYVFSDPKWATQNEYKKYERASTETQPGKSISKAYLNHIRASYEYDPAGKEYGSLGHDDGLMRSVSYKKLFIFSADILER